MSFPNVPLAPGVPPVLRTIATIETTAVLLIADAVLLAAAFAGPSWGIFDQDGFIVIDPETFVSFDYRKEFRNSTFPVEEGGFASYNKVETPYEARLTVAQGGTEIERVAFIDKIDELVKSLDLYTIITPEATYENANIVHFDYRRTQKNGATMFIVDIWVDEIREVQSSQFIAAQDSSGAQPTSSGQVQSTPASSPSVPKSIAAQDASYHTATPTVLV